MILFQNSKSKGGLGVDDGGWEETCFHELLHLVRRPVTVAELQQSGMDTIDVNDRELKRLWAGWIGTKTTTMAKVYGVLVRKQHGDVFSYEAALTRLPNLGPVQGIVEMLVNETRRTRRNVGNAVETLNCSNAFTARTRRF